jgi:hypothetical protein
VQPLIFQIFTPDEAEAIRRLWDTPEDKKFLKDAIARRILESENIILGHALNQVCLITSRATFADTEEESVIIASMLFYCLKLEDVFPSLLEHRGKEFSSRAMISLSLYRSHMDSMCQRRGAPTSDYYRSVSKVYLKAENMPEIAEHHIKWESFLAEHFA